MRHACPPYKHFGRRALCFLNLPSEIRNLKAFSEAGMNERSLNIFNFKGYSIKLGDASGCPDKLPWIDGKGFSNSIHVSAGEFWRLMDMAMKG